jgi:hypothetical protein
VEQLISSIDFTKDYYFSYFYDLTHTLQHNMMQSPSWSQADTPTPPPPAAVAAAAAAAATSGARSGPGHTRNRSGLPTSPFLNGMTGNGLDIPSLSTNGSHRSTPNYNEMFLWNLHLAREFLHQLPHASYWLVPVIHGFFSQACMTFISFIHLILLSCMCHHVLGMFGG